MPELQSITPKPENVIHIFERDWLRICGELEELRKRRTSILPGAAAAFFGIAASSLLGYFPWSVAVGQLPTAAQLHYSYVSPLLIIVTIAAFILGVALMVLNRSVSKSSSSEAAKILEEMKDIHDRG
jgi:hypothetical protein